MKSHHLPTFLHVSVPTLKSSPTHPLTFILNISLSLCIVPKCVCSRLFVQLHSHAGPRLPAHPPIETRHHTLAKLAPSPVVAGLAPAHQKVRDPFLIWHLHVSLWMHWPPCWQGREQIPPSQLRPWKPAGQSHTPACRSACTLL